MLNTQNYTEPSAAKVQQSRERGFRGGYTYGAKDALTWLIDSLLLDAHVDIAVVSRLREQAEAWEVRLDEWSKPENVDRLGTMVVAPKPEGEN